MLRAHDPNQLRLLIEESVAETKRKLSVMANQVEKYVGPFWDGKGSNNASKSAYSPENTYFEYLSAMVPRLVFRNPRVRVRPCACWVVWKKQRGGNRRMNIFGAQPIPPVEQRRYIA